MASGECVQSAVPDGRPTDCFYQPLPRHHRGYISRRRRAVFKMRFVYSSIGLQNTATELFTPNIAGCGLTPSKSGQTKSSASYLSSPPRSRVQRFAGSRRSHQQRRQSRWIFMSGSTGVRARTSCRQLCRALRRQRRRQIIKDARENGLADHCRENRRKRDSAQTEVKSSPTP